MQASQNTTPPQCGDTLSNLTVTDLSVSGGGIARHNGQVVFLDGGLPNEIVNALVTSCKKKIINAQVVEIIKKSPDRIDPACPHFADCGGCTWQNLSLEAQQQWKARHVQQTLTRIGKIENPNFQGLLASPKSFEFRNKMSFAFGLDSEEKLVLGLRMRDARSIVEVTDCNIFPKLGMAVLAKAREFFAQNPLPLWEKGQGFLRFLVIRIPAYKPVGEPACIVECITGKDLNRDKSYSKVIKKLGEELLNSGLSVQGFAHTEKRGADQVAQGEKLIKSLAKISFKEKIGELILQVPCDGFVQTNPAAASILYKQIEDFANLQGTEKLWDIYCGVGGIGLLLASKVQSLHGFDWQESSINTARDNATALNYHHCCFVAGELSKTLRKEKSSPDVVILDPPRAGLDPEVLQIIDNSTARKIVYVSCDVATQARDIAKLDSAWQVKKSVAVDMFPHSPHVESVVLLER